MNYLKSYVGIDPGTNGGIAAFNSNGELIFWGRLPYEHEMPNYEMISGIVKGLNPEFVAIEKQFNNAVALVNEGFLKGILIQLADIVSVHSRTWQAYFKLRGDKTSHVQYVETNFISLSDFRNKEVKHGIADAILIARWCYDKYGKKE